VGRFIRARFKPGLFLVAAALLLLSVPAWGAGATVNDATPDQLKAAQKTFEVANDLFDAGRYEEAITAFRASYDIVASPNSRLMVARSLRELGRLDEAYQEFEASLADAKAAAAKDAKKYTKTVAAVEAEIATLRQRVAIVRLELTHAPSGTTVKAGDRTIEGAALGRPLLFAPGEIVISARGPGGETAEQKVQLVGGTEQTVRLDLSGGPQPPPAAAPAAQGGPPPAEASVGTDGGGPPLRTLGLVAGGIGVLGLATFAVFGSLNNSKFDDLESSCQADGTCATEKQDDIDTGRTYQTVANIGLVVGAVGVAAGATLFVLGSSSERAARPVHVAVGPGRIAIGGRF
jgi:hypothetical protein